MLKFKSILHCFVKIFFITAALNSSSYGANDDLVIAIENWPPYSDQGHPRYGLATEIVATALDRAGYSFRITFENWSDILRGAQVGVFDIISAGWHTEEREKYFAYSEPYLFNEVKFIKQKGKPFNYGTLDDLRGVIVGVVENYAYLPEFDTSSIPIKFSNRHVIQNLLLLQQGKIDLTLDDEWVIRHQLNNYMPHAIDQFVFLDKPLAKRSLHMLVSLKNKKHEKIIADFNRAIMEMKDDGTFIKILNAYKEQLLNTHN